jgi:AcrR family transcriptional regulator
MADLKREDIIAYAIELFRKRGIRDVTIDEISKHFRISKKTFYQFFPTKEDLVSEAVLTVMAQKRNDAEKSLKDKNPVEILDMIPKLINDYRFSDPGVEIIDRDLSKYYPNVMSKVSFKYDKSIMDQLREFIHSGCEMGFFRTDLDESSCLLLLAFVTNGIVDYQNSERKYALGRVSLKALLSTLVDIITHAILSEKGWEEYHRIENENKSRKANAARSMRRAGKDEKARMNINE